MTVIFLETLAKEWQLNYKIPAFTTERKRMFSLMET